MSETLEIENTVVVVTGASSGFGRGVALELARKKAHLVLAARSSEALENLAGECRIAGARAVPATVDVSSRDDMKRLHETALSSFGRIDTWINNAGICALGRFEEIPLEDHEQVVKTNLMGVLYGSHHALVEFRKRGRGLLINVASALGKVPAPYYASYAASKFAVVGLGAALRQELKQNDLPHIHVSTVMPMSCDTPFFDHLANYTGREVKPVPPLYDPGYVVETIVKLCSRPEAEVTVGAAGKASVALHNVSPQNVENLMGTHAHLFTMEKGTSAPPSSGAVHNPSQDGRVHAGRK